MCRLHGRSALLIAIDNENIEMMELSQQSSDVFVDHAFQAKAGDFCRPELSPSPRRQFSTTRLKLRPYGSYQIRLLLLLSLSL